MQLLIDALPIFCFFFNDTATTEIYTLSLHDALPICKSVPRPWRSFRRRFPLSRRARDRKSTRLNSSHLGISYAVFCLKKKVELCKRSLLPRLRIFLASIACCLLFSGSYSSHVSVPLDTLGSFFLNNAAPP